MIEKPFPRRGFLRGAAMVLAGSVPAAAAANRALVEPVLAADTLPPNPYPPSVPHLIETQQLIDYLDLPACPAGNNAYNTSDVVTWGTPGQPSTWVNQSECASFLTAVLYHTYPAWANDTTYIALFGHTGPNAREYRSAFAAGSAHFQPVGGAPDLLPGDLIAIDYQNGQTTDTGHAVMVRRVIGPYVAPQSSLNFPGETQYAVEVADCTATPHGTFGATNYAAFPDTRIVDATTETNGAGYGHMMFYADATGAFSRYRWSVNSSTTYTVAQRLIAAARVV